MLNGKAYADALNRRTETVCTETHDALQAVVDGLNKGQRQKLAKIEAIKKLFERYGVEI